MLPQAYVCQINGSVLHPYRLSPQPTKTSSHGGRKITAAGSSVDPDDEIDSGSDEEGGSLANSAEEAGTLTQVGVP